MKQLLGQAQPWKIVLGARNTAATQAAYDGFTVNPAAKGASSVTVLPLELSDLHGVRAFAQQALAALGNDKIDYLLLNAAIAKPATETGQGPNRSKWCETYIVNHLCESVFVIHARLSPTMRTSHPSVAVGEENITLGSDSGSLIISAH